MADNEEVLLGKINAAVAEHNAAERAVTTAQGELAELMTDDQFPEFYSTIVRLDRSTDRERPCCENLATLRPGKGPHGAELRCAGCGRHRGWLPKQATEFLATVADRFGDPDPIILRDQTIGDFVLKKFDNSNSGVLFKNENKQSEKHADYRGEINAAGVDYWLDGWVRTSKKGTKFISFKLKPKDDQPNRVKESVAKDTALLREFGFGG